MNSLSNSSALRLSSWTKNPTRDLLAGTVVALALIPEAIAFSLIAKVPPAVGLYASFCIAVVISFFGGRPGMISAATGAMALVLAGLVKEHGVELGLQYILAATLLTGVIQFILGWFKVGELMRFVSKSVVTGFINALAILIFMAQFKELGILKPHGEIGNWEFIWRGWPTYLLVAGGLFIIYGLPRITKAVPSPLVAIVCMTALALSMNWISPDLKESAVRTVKHLSDEANATLPNSLPFLQLPKIPLTWETFMIILPYSISLTAVGLLESLMTAQIVDEATETTSDRNQEARGQGIANVVSGFFGGMAGCAMIGQSIINVKSGGRGRLSTLWAGIFLLILVIVLQKWVEQIPMGVLVAVMIMVSISTFSWKSFAELKKHPWTTSAVMLLTVFVTVKTDNLALGVGAGVLLSTVFFARKIAQLLVVDTELDEAEKHRTYRVYGQVFFASGDSFIDQFDLKEANLDKVTIDMSHAHFWDLTGVAALDKVVFQFRKQGVSVEVLGMNAASKTIVSRLGKHDKDEKLIDELTGH